MLSSHIKSRELRSTSLRKKYLHNLFKLFMGNLSLPSHVFLFNDLCQFELMDIYFVFWVTVLLYLLVSQIFSILAIGSSYG